MKINPDLVFIGLAAAAVAAYHMIKSDPLLLSIDQWKDECAPGENRTVVANIIKNAYERSLAELTLRDETITTLPKLLPEKLKILNLPGCKDLKELPEKLPNSLEILNVFDCDELKTIPTVGPYCVVVKPRSLTPDIFVKTLTDNAVDMSTLLTMTEEGRIKNGLEHIERIRHIECPISLSEPTNSKVVLIANSMREPSAKVICTLYELESLEPSIKNSEGLYINPLTKEVLRSVDIIDINKQVNIGNLAYNEQSNNFELIKCPDLGHEKNSVPIYKLQTLNNLHAAAIGSLIPQMELNNKQTNSSPQLLAIHDLAKFICKNRLV